MLVTTHLIRCSSCGDTAPLMAELDCFLTDKALVLLNNARFGFRKKVSTVALKDTLRYKRILTALTVNPAYADAVPFSSIVNKVKQLTYGL